MPYFTLHRTFVLRTTKGHSIGFVKGQRAWVPPECVPDAVAIGAVPDEAVDVIGEEEAPTLFLTPQEREAKLFAAFETMIARGERSDFTASNVPNAKKASSLCGFEVGNKERDAAWQAFTARQVAEQE